MCGISVILTRQESQHLAESLATMHSVLRHRGPDDEGFLLGDYFSGKIQASTGKKTVDQVRCNHKDINYYFDQPFNLGLGHNRLAIIDPSPLGHQPMTSAYGNNWIVYNGEIYTFRELRTELEKQGYAFVSKSDTEVLLNFYHRYGAEGIKNLNGIFAFVLWDVHNKKIFAARDHFGVKPLYYFLDSQKFVIASEIKAILQVTGIQRAVDKKSLDDYLTFRYNPSPHTLLEGIKKLPPGHSLLFDPLNWTEKIFRYFDKPPCIITNRSLNDWAEIYAETLKKAVRRQMVSDVPIGALLSGGVDSSLVTAIASSFSSKPLKTFTVGFEESYSDTEFEEAKEVSSLLGTDHVEILLKPEDYFSLLSDTAWFMDEPIGSSSSVAMYDLCRRSSQDVKVVLTGQGADEPLAGYARYKAEKWAALLGPMIGNRFTRWVVKHLPRNEQLKRATRALGEKDWKARYLKIYALFDDHQKKELLKPDFLVQNSRPYEYLDYWTKGIDGVESLNRMLHIDTRMGLVDDLLNYGDKMSMAASLEARVPLLDIELITLIESMPSGLKLKGWKKGKFIHKFVAERWLPGHVVHRVKKGFPTPLDQWFQKELSGEITRMLLSPSSFCSRYFNVNHFQSMIENHISRREDYSRQLFALLFFEFWAQRFLKPN